MRSRPIQKGRGTSGQGICLKEKKSWKSKRTRHTPAFRGCGARSTCALSSTQQTLAAVSVWSRVPVRIWSRGHVKASRQGKQAKREFAKKYMVARPTKAQKRLINFLLNWTGTPLRLCHSLTAIHSIYQNSFATLTLHLPDRREGNKTGLAAHLRADNPRRLHLGVLPELKLRHHQALPIARTQLSLLGEL